MRSNSRVRILQNIDGGMNMTQALQEAKTLNAHKLHKAWLKITAVIVGSFGPVFFFGDDVGDFGTRQVDSGSSELAA
jgi:hypothetical protein